MKMTLRKAHRLVKTLEQNCGVQFTNKNVHGSVSPEELGSIVSNVYSSNEDKIFIALQLIDSISNIRSLVQQKNAVVLEDGFSIDTLLNKKANLEMHLRLRKQVASNPTDETDESVFKLLVRSAQDALTINSPYASARNIDVGGFSATLQNKLNGEIYDIKKELEEVTDKLAYANNYLTIELDDGMMNFFKELKIA